mgnify:CR=1 FL=1
MTNDRTKKYDRYQTSSFFSFLRPLASRSKSLETVNEPYRNKKKGNIIENSISMDVISTFCYCCYYYYFFLCKRRAEKKMKTTQRRRRRRKVLRRLQILKCILDISFKNFEYTLIMMTCIR